MMQGAARGGQERVRFLSKRWLLRLNTAVADRLSVNRNGQPEQMILAQLYRRSFLELREALPSFDVVGFRVFSQTDEDGYILASSP